MKQYFVFSVMGTDRPGLVDRVTQAVVKAHGNLEDSRMAVLGGEFAIMMLVSVEGSRSDVLKEEVARACQELHLVMTVKSTRPRQAAPATMPLRVQVRGMDHEGIVHEVAHYLVGQGASVESLETSVSHAPHSGTMLFSMDLRAVLPASVSLAALRERLDEIGESLNVDIEVEAEAVAV